MSYKKLKKKQLIKIIIDRENDVEKLQEQLSTLQIEKELLEQEPPKKNEIIKEEEIELNEDDKLRVEFLEKQVNTTIYTNMKYIYQSELNRILNTYEKVGFNLI